MFQGKAIYLGVFMRFEDAVKARKDAEEKNFMSTVGAELSQ